MNIDNETRAIAGHHGTKIGDGNEGSVAGLKTLSASVDQSAADLMHDAKGSVGLPYVEAMQIHGGTAYHRVCIEYMLRSQALFGDRGNQST